MNTEELTRFLDDHKAEISNAIKAKVIEQLTQHVSWNLPDLIRKDVEKFYTDEIRPAVKEYLDDNKSGLMQVVIKACTDASEAVATSMAEHVKKTMSSDYNAKKVFSALFGGSY